MKTIQIIINECRNFIFLGKSCLLLLFMITIASCGKDDDTQPSYEDGKSTVIYDLAGDTEASVGDGVDGKEQRSFYTFLYRFSDQRQIWIKTKADSLQYLKTDDWDIAFTAQYNSEIYVNNANNQFNPGYQGEATNTAVVLIKDSYANVTTAPSDEEFDNSTIEKIGVASSTNSNGWFQYDSNTHIMLALPNRTYAIRLPDGKYAKLQIINAYKGNPTTVTNLNWPAPYYTFRYFVQEDGSKNLNTN
ncbi:HmuY family protein [Sphingobacterium sp. LRF_L2]|uniref:HmuY family protein n=1 Tax=Sphingobacterium sp. LRF_L2 TaxID=3369421 RepID=UPI003F60E64E